MKEEYVEPEIELIEFSDEDIVTASGDICCEQRMH